MNLLSVIGLTLTLGIFLASVFIALGGFASFIDAPSALIVVGGSIGATVACSPLKRIKGGIGMFFSRMIKKEKKNYAKLIEDIVELAKARRKGEATFNGVIKKVEDKFLADAAGVLFWTDTEVSGEELHDLLKTRMSTYLKDSHKTVGFFRTLSKFPPAFGMMGTVLGLIALLQSLSSPDAKSQIGPAMAIALVTTLYGIALNNLAIIPITEHLSDEVEEDMRAYKIVIEGMMLIHQERQTRYIEEKLRSFVMPEERGEDKKSA